MTSSGFILTRLYAWLLSFYPRPFQREYGSEMQAVFEQALDEASASGQASMFLLKELRDWPIALLRIYLQERRIRNMSVSLNEKPIHRWGLLVGIGLFMLPILYHVSSKVFHNVISGVFLVLFLVFVLAALLFGIIKGLPRWCLPSFGMLLGVVWMYGGLPWPKNRAAPLSTTSLMMSAKTSLRRPLSSSM